MLRERQVAVEHPNRDELESAIEGRRIIWQQAILLLDFSVKPSEPETYDKYEKVDHSIFVNPALALPGLTVPAELKFLNTVGFTTEAVNCILCNMTAAALYLVLYGERCGVAWPTSSWQKLFGGRGQTNLLSRASATAFKKFIDEQPEWSKHFFVENGYEVDDVRSFATRILPKFDTAITLLANFVQHLEQHQFNETEDATCNARGLEDIGEVIVVSKGSKGKKSKAKADEDQMVRQMKLRLKRINDDKGKIEFAIDTNLLDIERRNTAHEKRQKDKAIRAQLRQRYPDNVLPEAYGDVHERAATEGECHKQASYIPGWREYEVAREGRRREANMIFSGARIRYTDYESQSLAPKRIALPSDIFQYKRSFTKDLSCGGDFTVVSRTSRNTIARLC
jgi:hypothetical protein